jgi:two-component system, sensor histidine kinase LadS
MLMTYLGRYKSFKEDPESAMLPKPILLVLHGVLMASVALSVFPFLGFVRASIYLLYAPIVHAIISGSILVYVLQVRAHRKTIVNEQIKGKYSVLKEKLLLEQEFRQEQQNLLEMLAHEIKTPLAVIRLLVRRKSTSENVLARVDQAASEMRTIVDRCVQAARTTDKEHPFQKTQLDPLVVLRDVAHTHVSPNRIEILCDHGFSVEADEQLIRMALSNLLENACKYGNPALPVTVTLQQTLENGREGVSFVVANAPGSAGWPDADRLFSKYYRSPHAHRQTGSGLGLYLVTIFAKQCGGFVRYCPTEERVRFEFWIPLSHD